MSNSLLIIRNQDPFYCGPFDGGEYDLSEACSVCGTGARRVSPIKLPSSRLKNRVSITQKHEVVVPERVAEAIKRVAPHCLRQVLYQTTGDPTKFYELIAETTLPRWSSQTTGWCLSQMDPPCPTCKRDGHFNVVKEPLRLIYSGTPPFFSVARTYEAFGKSRLLPKFRDSNFAVHFLVVCAEVMDLLRGERGVEFVPVEWLTNSEPENWE